MHHESLCLHMQWLGTSCSVPSSSMSHMPQTSQHIVLQPELSTAAVCSACAAAGHLPSCLRLAGLPICCSPGQRCLLSKVSLLFGLRQQQQVVIEFTLSRILAACTIRWFVLVRHKPVACTRPLL